jgi:non-ribosomal peptide synthetase component F
MSEASPTLLNLPLGQQGILDKSFHPSGTFVEFPIEETEQSIPQRFENIVALYPSCPAVKANGQCLTYDELNRFANRIAHALF